MRILLDSHIVVASARGNLHATRPLIAKAMAAEGAATFVSVATFWELAIKHRLGRIDIGMTMEELAAYVASGGSRLVDVNTSHVFAAVEPEPPTRDPFDRLLLGVCAAEGLKLATADRALIGHPLALQLP